MNQLPIFVNLKGRKVILLGDGEMARAKRRLYERAGAVLTANEHAEAMLAVVALEDDDEAAAAAARLKARGLLVNAVDRPQLCDFTTPAIIDRDPVLIAIGTGGASAGLAKALRQRLEHMLPANLGRLAGALRSVRDAIRRRWPDDTDRRKAIDAALETDGPLDVMQDRSADRVHDWLGNPAALEGAQVIDMELTSGDPDKLTLKQARWLAQADQIFADAAVPLPILDRARADAARYELSLWDQSSTQGIVLRIRMKR